MAWDTTVPRQKKTNENLSELYQIYIYQLTNFAYKLVSL